MLAFFYPLLNDIDYLNSIQKNWESNLTPLKC